MNYLYLSISLVAAYLLGSFPSSYIWGMLFKGIDIRQHGSGNAGATNAFRVLGAKAGIAVLLADVAKGVAAILLAKQLLLSHNIAPWWLAVVGVITILGHIFSIFLSFSGGKGVATATGVLAALTPWPFLAALSVFIILVGLTRYISLGSICGALTLAGVQSLLYFSGRQTRIDLLLLSLAVAFIVVITHKGNIGRLLSGNERKIRFKG